MDAQTGTMTVFRFFDFYIERYVEIASHRYQEGIQSKLDPSRAWNVSGVDWVTAARVSFVSACTC